MNRRAAKTLPNLTLPNGRRSILWPEAVQRASLVNTVPGGAEELWPIRGSAQALWSEQGEAEQKSQACNESSGTSRQRSYSTRTARGAGAILEDRPDKVDVSWLNADVNGRLPAVKRTSNPGSVLLEDRVGAADQKCDA